MGGKSRLAKRIIEKIPEHMCYCEPFSGAAWVFFGKEKSAVEVLNDLDGELVNYWRVIQNHYQEFLRHYQHGIVSRELFDLEKEKNPDHLTDVQRAVRYHYLQRLAFGGQTKNRNFGISCVRPSSLNFETLENTIRKTHERLKQVYIEHLDACKCIGRYDSSHTFFYIDPPYWNVAGYAVDFGVEDFYRLRDTLLKVKGKFILSLNDTPEVRNIFKHFQLEEVVTNYSLANARNCPDSRKKPRQELLILNFDLGQERP